MARSKAELMRMSAEDLQKEAEAAGIQKASENNKEQNAAAIASKEAESVTEAEMDAASQTTGEALSGQPKESIKLYQVPPGSTDRALPDEVVCINGYTYQIQRGVEVEVPESVAQVLRDAGRL